MPLGQWSGHIWQTGDTNDSLVPASRSPTPQIQYRSCTPSTPPSRLDTRSPAIPSRNGFHSRCSTRCTTRASSRLSTTKAGKYHVRAKTPNFDTPRSISPKSESDEEDVQLAKQAHTIRKWSYSTQEEASYALPLTFLAESESIIEPETITDQRIITLYNASVELTEVGISTVMAPSVARRFENALEHIKVTENGCFEPNDFVNEELFHDDLFLEAMEAYTTYGKMESIVCEMQTLIIDVLKVLNDDSEERLDIVAGQAIGVAVGLEEVEHKTNAIMERVFGLLAALSAEAKSFNYTAWLQAMGESELEVTELVEEFMTQKQEIRKLLWISNIEADEFLNSRLLVAAMTFAKWFEKMRKAADEFEEFLLKQYEEGGSYGWYRFKRIFQQQSEERKRLALRLQEKKESCKKEALESHGKRLEAAIEMRRERDAEKEFEPPPSSGLPTERGRRIQVTSTPSMAPGGGSPHRRISFNAKRSSHMEEQIMTFLGHAREHLDELQAEAQEVRHLEQRAAELLLRLLTKMRVLERRRLRKAADKSISQRVNDVMPGRFVAMHAKKPWPANEDFTVTSSLLQQQAICRDLNSLSVPVELKDIWTGVEGKFLMKKKKKKPKPKKNEVVKTEEKAPEIASPAVNLWSQARDSVAVGSAVNAIQSLQTKEEAKKEEVQAPAQEAEKDEDDDDDLFNFPPHFSLVDVQLLLSDAAVTRTERLRELRQELSQVAQQVGAKYGRQAWDYNAKALEAHSNTNPWAVLVPIVEKEMMNLGESGRFFLSRQDAANLQDLNRLMRTVKSQMAVETSKSRSHFDDDEERWSFISEIHIRALIEQLRQMHQTLQDRKNKAARLDIRAELTQELAQLHPELRSSYGLAQKRPPPKKPAKEEVEQEEDEEDRTDSFKTFLFALKFKQKMSEAQNATKLRETKVQLDGTIANAQKMIRDGFEVTKTLDSEKEGVQTEVHYLKKLHNRIEMTNMATFHLKQLKSEKALMKARKEAGASLPGALEPAGEAGGAVAPPSAPVETVSSPKRKKKDARDRTKEMKADIKKLKDGTTEDAPQSDVKAMQRPPVAGNAGNAGRLSVRKPDREQDGQQKPRSSWLARASTAVALGKTESMVPERGAPQTGPRGNVPQDAAKQRSATGPVGPLAFFNDKGAEGEMSGSEEDETGAARRQKDDKRGTLKRGDRKAQFNKIFTTTMQRRLRTATDRSAAMLFKKSLIEANRNQQMTRKILDSKRGDLQSFLKLTLSKHGIKTMHRIQSAKEQQERWNDEVDYMTTKLRRGAGMESMWRERHDAWLQEMKDTFGDMVLDAFVQADRFINKDQWSQRLQQILRETFEQMKEELPTAEVDVSHHIDVPEKDEEEGLTSVRLGEAHMAKLLQKQNTLPQNLEEEEEAAPTQAGLTLEDLPEVSQALSSRGFSTPARRPPGIPTASATQSRQKSAVVFQPDDVIDVPEPVESHREHELPSWLTAGRTRTKTRELVGSKVEAEDVESEVSAEIKVFNLARRRSVQPWLEPVDWIEDASYRAALKTLQKQFHKGKTREEEMWGYSPPVDGARRHLRRKLTERTSKALSKSAERCLSRRLKNFQLEELEDASERVHRTAWSPTAIALQCSLRRSRRRSQARARGLDCVLTHDGVRFRGLPRRYLEEDVSEYTEATETEAAGGESSTWLADATVRRLRRFRRKLLKRFCGPEEAYNNTVVSPISLLGYEQFCDMAEQISFDQTNTRMVWQKMLQLLGKEECEELELHKGEFSHAMSFACDIRDLNTLRIHLQLRYGSLAAAFDQMEKRHLDEDSWAELLASVGASHEEAKVFFASMLANGKRQTPKISRRTFLLVLQNAEGFAAGKSLMSSLKLSNEATAWRALMEHARRMAKHKGMRLDAHSITATELQLLLSPLSSDVHCEALIRMALSKRPEHRGPVRLRLEEVLLAAVSGLGRRAAELIKELGRDYEGEDSINPWPTRSGARAVPAPASLAKRLRSSMAVSVAEAARKLQAGDAHDGVSTLMGIVGKRPPSHTRSVASASSDTEDVPSISSRATTRKSSPQRSRPRSAREELLE
ncbi:unnamed protein product [Durusdinium trenchii]|uniref:Uncharacterized protein n=1 Tax=Durusdinium trenchii TaxID=1381693 RepID=A0ABP0M695_9DINO